MEHNIQFRIDKKAILIMGEQAIYDGKIAISELVKNSYDADANKVFVRIEDDCIEIEDDGIGMDVDIIKNYWLVAGSSSKTEAGAEKRRTKKYGRIPLGEKGIGRLGVQRLGSNVDIYSKIKNGKEIFFSIDWRIFDSKDTTVLNEMPPIVVRENESAEIKGDSGTKIVIRELRQIFDKKAIEKISADIQNLQSPFNSIDDFTIELYHKEGLFVDSDIIQVQDVKEQALMSFKVVFEKNNIIDFKYELHTKSHHKIPPKEITLKNLKDMDKDFLQKFQEITPYYDLGKIIFEGYIFENNLNKLLDMPLGVKIKKYIESNGGIRVYRDKLRIYNYGEEGRDNDLLDLEAKRSKKIGENIGFNQILASVEIQREKSDALQEKSNREGFIHNDEFEYLIKGLDRALNIVNVLRLDDKATIRIIYDGKIKDKASVSSRIEEITRTIQKSSINKEEKNTLQTQMNEFSQEFETTKDVFLTAASTGLNLTFVVHEIDKIIGIIEGYLFENNIEAVKTTFFHLQNIIRAYHGTIKMSKNSSVSLNEIIEQAIFNFNFRFSTHKIDFIKQIAEDIDLVCKQNLIIGAVMNIFDNSLYWLEEYKIEIKKILIKTYTTDDTINLIIADNGKGFNISFESALEPFISGRLDDSGMGIGLHLVSQIMIAHEGYFVHATAEDEALPVEYKDGAIVKLIFRRRK